MNWKPILLFVLLLPMVFVYVPQSYAHATDNSFLVYYHKYSSFLRESSMGIFNSEMYKVSNETYIGNSSHVEIKKYTTVYYLTSTGVEQISGTVNITISRNNSISIYSSLPYLSRVIVESSGITELAWSGLTTSSSTINTFAYTNSSSQIILQFLNGTSFTNISINISKYGTFTKQISVNLAKVKISNEIIYSTTEYLNVQLPRRYTPLVQSFYVNGTNISSQSNGYIVTKAYFNGSILPAIEWKGLGIGNNLDIMEMRGSLDFNFTTLEFYGINGSVVGYVHNVYSYFSSPNISLFSRFIVNYESGETIIVYVSSDYVTSHPYNQVYFTYNGVPILVMQFNNSVESSANITIFHKVIVNNEHANLINLRINSTSFYIVIINNQVHNVALVHAIVKETNINISGKAYLAQKIEINQSGYVVFNVTALGNAFTVFKIINNTYIKLNSTNYFEINGKIVVFDDPSNTYLVVYGYTSPSSSSSSSSTPQSVTSSISSTSSTPISNYYYIAIIVIIILAIVLIILRRK
ncbi:hypothetical protein [Acidianus manzaensis]|uniref:Thermopsin n=1 Tax=Acidianus manzaensis TaxID=282676 RepID=A0A1W6JXC1_9CREN|nr:hypothetical protein [Acidianus manzaensis]ARM74854.1 hypothetical protein B6F84_01635 [Acidianus manzaensis]